MPKQGTTSRQIDEWMADAPDPVEGAEPVEGNEALFEEWLAMGESADR